MSVAIAPPAPGLLSITMFAFSNGAILSASKRPRVSPPLPAAEIRMNRIGLFG